MEKAVIDPSIPPLSQDMFVSKTSSGSSLTGVIPDDLVGEAEDTAMVPGNLFSFGSSETSRMVMERIMSQSQEISPRTSGRLSHSSGPHIGSLSDRSPVSLSDMEDVKEHHSIVRSQSQNCPSTNHMNTQWGFTVSGGFGGGSSSSETTARGGLKDKKKEERRAQNAHLHAAISIAGVAAAVATTAPAATAGSGNDDLVAKMNLAVDSAATLVAAQCLEAAEAMGAKREQLSAVVLSAVNVRSAGDIIILTAAAATALRLAARFKARALKEVRNVAAVIPVERGVSGGSGGGGGGFSGELSEEENFLEVCSEELLERGCKLLKRTRKGDLHWKIVSVYINKTNEVKLKMKSRHVGGTFTKNKKNMVIAVIKDMPAWSGRHLLEGGENRRYFGLNTIARGIVEFECRNQREYDSWTQGVSRLLAITGNKTTRRRT